MAYLELFTEGKWSLSEHPIRVKRWRWHRKANNHRIIATSGESFVTKWSAKRSAHREYPNDEIRVANA